MYSVAGVPQGSVLGPLLFLIYINDLDKKITYSTLPVFADDTCIFIPVDKNNAIIAAQHLNYDLKLIQDWAEQWLVSFSATKTKTLTITNKTKNNQPPLFLQDQEIEKVDEHKQLGLIIQSNLKWNSHIETIARSANKKLNLMRKFKYDLNRKSLEIVYKSFIRPLVEYGDILWCI